ncbi:substrate-binding periplasmic protein [Pseudomonas xionganensis]|uniref:Transporter substrate-binding domain-containing protein n=1 Tax=Pseudomonas xionganensis TaxID=2654845 RepID=A0A6I4L0M2_9PSED|nr:transporter substrate-binding domain-containing protein [Pseudomonas xionganensis]MVW75553.1 transporter substrate-binding domain-containing protein [Pseudomonas xionganensis]
MNVRINLLLLLLPICFHAQAEHLEVTADEWCPLSCQPNAEKPGYAVEILQAVFPQETIHYRVTPWKRAVLRTTSGTSEALIGAVQDLAAKEGLLIGQEPIGYAQDCLYVASGHPARYRGKADDLNSLRRVGVSLGYVYTEGFKEWLTRPANKPKIFTASGDQPAALNLSKLREGTLDAVIETSMVMDYLLRQAELAETLVSVGCDTPDPVYVAFGKGSLGEERARQFDKGLALRSSGKLAEILANYDLEDWKQ